jgi:hypothetical protein
MDARKSSATHFLSFETTKSLHEKMVYFLRHQLFEKLFLRRTVDEQKAFRHACALACGLQREK